MSFLKSGDPLIVSATSPKTQHKTWNRCCGEGCYISWDLHTLETPPGFSRIPPLCPACVGYNSELRCSKFSKNILVPCLSCTGGPVARQG